MRAVLACALVALLVSALSDPASPVVRPATAEPTDALTALQQEVAEMKSRDAQLRAKLEKVSLARADALDRLVADLRTLGFAGAANPTPARERLLRGMSQLATSLREDLPTR